jgi:hypothetical protein
VQEASRREPRQGRKLVLFDLILLLLLLRVPGEAQEAVQEILQA